MNKITRTLVLTTAALVTVGGLTACSSGSDTPTATTTVTATPTPVAPQNRVAAPTTGADEASFLAFIDEHASPSYASTPDSVQLDLGYTMCEAMDSGMSVDSILQAGLDSDISVNDVTAHLASAGGFLCPENLPLLKAYAAS